MLFKKKNILVINYMDLPKKIQKAVDDGYGRPFNNDCYLNFNSEFEPKELTTEQVESYWKDQVKNNGFIGDLNNFIDEYGLQFEMWLIGKKLDLSDVDEILIKVCW